MRGLSAGLLLFRRSASTLEVLLVRPGGPYWRKRDIGAWQIPKGAIEEGEEPLQAAFREVEEELGFRPEGEPFPLGRIRQTGGKLVEAFALESDFDCQTLTSISFEMEWPPRSGRKESFPEVEEARWLTLPAAAERILPSQAPLLDRLTEALRLRGW
ncbi:NUDIX domain-containing protein [Sphingomonas tabacisoli]|uniref:NUDIX domain-containing protein n=1 Tax=Sphingomonas tabacisoli TaxID=2249466 RepID=A0ABW4I7Z9_9SPHN